MQKAIITVLAACVMAVAVPSSAQVTTYNSNPTGGFQYGTGNNYTPANATVLTDGNNELAVRFHEYQNPASASTSGLYVFALGTDVSYDFSIGGATSGSNIRLTNLLTSAFVTYDPLCPISPLCFLNDNKVSAGGDIQNSQRLSFSQFSGLGFDANANNTYRLDLTAGGNTVTSFAQLGAGATVSAVPEPATWAMILVGFGAVGAGMRRGKKQNVGPQFAIA
ncbi:PEPxxWA-CTERM sorting domain-containing protein [Sphingomonas sp. M1-B02]|uniref:PEPxxWA-CTERM sorting domain-containing protein n=1 Tax=Sphingomonas sp. M1-B02 TaxID=3114300 RepID=UPI00223F2370|nr:PEPxxWA-CTERM sorting domain-containing protein [Sphingomonas sp. S6-11]UZK67798.1 PEPxxWA-CTERM sorting domain-containing protein [Sphingomonas sp. S6-11]